MLLRIIVILLLFVKVTILCACSIDNTIGRRKKIFTFKIEQINSDSIKFNKLKNKFIKFYSFDIVQSMTFNSDAIYFRKEKVSIIGSLYYRYILFLKKVSTNDYSVVNVRYNYSKGDRIKHPGKVW